MENLRKSKRTSCAVPVDGKQATEFAGLITVDLSKGGVGFVSMVKIPVNKEIALEVVLKEDEDPVLAIGKVQWIAPIKGTKQYRGGIIFKDVLRGSKSRLNKYFSTNPS